MGQVLKRTKYHIPPPKIIDCKISGFKTEDGKVDFSQKEEIFRVMANSIFFSKFADQKKLEMLEKA
jgi:hypothetical protein